MKNANEITKAKTELRNQIFLEKRRIGLPAIKILSEEIITKLESTTLFKEAQHILLYHSLPYEVSTTDFIEKWYEIKHIYLPVVVGNELRLKLYKGKKHLTKGPFGVWEPIGEFINDYKQINLTIVPGVAFDKSKRRMGYGKGFYDKLLINIDTKKAGICFDFQLFEQIPADNFDQSVDIILTESQIVL